MASIGKDSALLAALVALLVAQAVLPYGGLATRVLFNGMFAAVLHLRHALFNFFSFATLTSLGYNDITPVTPLANTLTWLEVIFGQFYMAVVVAQLVGMRLAQAVQPGGPASK